MASTLALLDRRAFLSLGAVAVASTVIVGGWAARSMFPSWRDLLPWGRTPYKAGLDAYQDFRTRFVLPEGRVVDTFNGNISHSEGQGWGMVMAVAFDDQATFNLLWDWTKRCLRRPDDRLTAWRYQPGAENLVGDMNNATDGDLYIAGALARGARKWNRPELAAEATAIGKDIQRLLVRRVGTRTVLLPGASGFEKDDGVIINPSYYVFPLIEEVAALVPSNSWSRLRDDGVRLINDGRFGPWALPPDWLKIDRNDGSLSPAPGWPPRFSYDAIRIPLYLAWGGIEATAMIEAFARYWNASHPYRPAWVDLPSGTIAPYPADAGIRAVADLALTTPPKRNALFTSTSELQIEHASDYFPSALIVLSHVAAIESHS